jgi:hypothetical protein
MVSMLRPECEYCVTSTRETMPDRQGAQRQRLRSFIEVGIVDPEDGELAVVGDELDARGIFPGIARLADLDEHIVGHDVGVGQDAPALDDAARAREPVLFRHLPWLDVIGLAVGRKDPHQRLGDRVVAQVRRGRGGAARGGGGQAQGKEE